MIVGASCAAICALASLRRAPPRGEVPPIAVALQEVLELPVGFPFRKSAQLMNPANGLLTVAGGDGKRVTGELAPPFLRLSAELHPDTADAIPIHGDFPPSASQRCCASRSRCPGGPAGAVAPTGSHQKARKSKKHTANSAAWNSNNGVCGFIGGLLEPDIVLH